MIELHQIRDWIISSAEWVTIAALVPVFVIARWKRLDRFFTGPTGWLLANERRPMIAVFALALLAGAVTSAVRPAWPIVHDEYSYLLAADTFAHGRVTNPTHPFWQHFETFHVLQQPSHQSKFPPAQGLFLAVGQVLTGAPIVGVWLSLALACGALYWCLRGWAPRIWALFGATLPCIRFGSGVFWEHEFWAYWSASYWGGAVALLGGCLALGAAPRLLRNPRRRHSLLLGLGFGVLAASRPFEGLIVAVLISAVLLVALVQRSGWAAAIGKLAPALLVVAGCLTLLSFYHWRVTGSLFMSPYSVYADTYDVVPVFTFQELGAEPEYRHEPLRRFHLGSMVRNFQYQQKGPGIDIRNLRHLGDFFLGPSLTLVMTLGLFWRSRWLLLILLALLAAAWSHAVTLSAMFRPHYFAPFAPMLLLLVINGLRILHTFRFRRYFVGAPIARAVAVSCVLVFAAGVVLRARAQWPLMGRWNQLESGRRQVVEQLSDKGPNHLVFVRYKPEHNVHHEWVYNLSDMDEAPVIWAREMTPVENMALREYYGDRQAWIVEADERPLRLLTYE